jgi:hypothetical protein
MKNIEVSFFEGGIAVTKPTKTVSLEWVEHLIVLVLKPIYL